MICPVPEETARIARAAYPRGNVYLQLRDELGTVYQDQAFAHLFSACGKPALARFPFASCLPAPICRGTRLLGKPPMRFEGGWTGNICWV